MSLLNPGTLTEYEGGPSRGRRSRGTVRVRDPAHGFFVAGSSLDDMNGIYGRVGSDHLRFLATPSVRRRADGMRLCYRHDSTGWLMVMLEVDPETADEDDDEDEGWRYSYREPCGMQWRFIDEGGTDRFRHKGDTIVPGAGTRWKHVRPKAGARATDEAKMGSDSDSDSDGDGDSEGVDRMALEDAGPDGGSEREETGELVETKEDDSPPQDDEDELPWQVIAILDRSTLEDLRFSSACRDEKIERSLKGLDVEQPPESTIEGFLEAEMEAVRAIRGDGRGRDDPAVGEEGGARRDDTTAPRGWLYQVAAEGGVELYTAPSSDECGGGEEEKSSTPHPEPRHRRVGARSAGDYVRAVEVRGQWVRLAPTERPLRDPPLTVGNSVRVVSGHYSGAMGEISSDLNPETRELGVRLRGYTGTGRLHASVLKRDGPIPGSRSARRAERERASRERRERREERRSRREARREMKERQLEAMRAYYGDQFADFFPSYLYEDESSEGGDDTEDEAENLANRLFGGVGSDGDGDGSDEGEEEEEEDGYDDSYDGPLWVAVTGTGDGEEGPLLVRASHQDGASLTAGAERKGAEMFDRPFEPRIEGASSSSFSSSGEALGKGVEEAYGEDAGGKADRAPAAAVPSPLLGAAESQNCPAKDSAAAADEDGDGDAFPVGSRVSLHGLRSAGQYNGRAGTVIARRNADGRCGVRLDPPTGSDNVGGEECDKKLLVKTENISPEGGAAVVSEGGRLERAARVLNVRLDAVGLGRGGGGDSAAPVDPATARDVLDALLRAADRDCHPRRPEESGASSERMMSDAFGEAERAHAALVHAVEGASAGSADGGGGASALAGMAPHLAVEAGFLGERARSAALAAGDASDLDRASGGVAALRSALEDERARLLRRQAVGGLVRMAQPAWRLERAEAEAAGGAGAGGNDDGGGGGAAEDCLRLRLAIVRALFESRADATPDAEAAVKLYPHSAAVHLWRGRCLLRRGLRTEGMAALGSCTALGPGGGTGGAWAHGEGVRILRSMRRTLKCEFRARDAYERGNFAVAAKVYGEMMEEFDGHASDDEWGRAEALVARAACHRRDRDLASALADCDAALSIFPRYPRALFRRALCLLEDRRPRDALGAFEHLLRVDRGWPNLLDWLIRSVAQARRMEANGGSGGDGSPLGDGDNDDLGGRGAAPAGNEDYYSVLGVSTDATEDQLKRAYRLMSLKVHPDKKGGSSAAFQLVATAYEALSDPEKRQLYDDGVDLSKKKRKKKGEYDDSSSESEDEDGNKKKSLREEVERRYFPENFKFWPFGDPFINKRRHQARKRKQEEQEKARKARMGDGRRPHPWWHGHNDRDL